MSDSGIIDTIAGIIADESSECHRYGNGCQLGYVGNLTAERILAALRDAGYAIVKLPEPDEPGDTDDEAAFAAACEQVRVRWSGDIIVGGNWYNAAEARETAAALLAAADAAEEGK